MTVSVQGTQFLSAATQLAIVGDGTTGLAIAATLSSFGQSVALWSADGKVPLEYEVRQRDARVGHVRSKTNFSLVSPKLEHVVRQAQIVFLSGSATVYGATLNAMAAGLSEGQTIILADAPLGAALQFSRQLSKVRQGFSLPVLEMGKLFDTIKLEGDVALLVGARRKVSICGLSRNETRRCLPTMSQMMPGLVPASNLLERGFCEVERYVAAALIVSGLLGNSLAEPRNAPSLAPAVVAVVAAIDRELSAVAREFGIHYPGIGQTLVDYAGANGRTFAEILAGMHAAILPEQYEEDAQEQMLRRLRREISESFVLLEQFARLARQPVPVIDSLIELASVLTECDLRKEGRGLGDLGLVGLDAGELMEAIDA